MQKDKIYRYGLIDLQACKDTKQFAAILGVEPKFLTKQIFFTDDSKKYSRALLHKSREGFIL